MIQTAPKKERIRSVEVWKVASSRYANIPLDMLRYDRAYVSIDEMKNLLSPLGHTLDESIEILYLNDKAPTLGRWESFGETLQSQGTRAVASLDPLTRWGTLTHDNKDWNTGAKLEPLGETDYFILLMDLHYRIY